MTLFSFRVMRQVTKTGMKFKTLNYSIITGLAVDMMQRRVVKKVIKPGDMML